MITSNSIISPDENIAIILSDPLGINTSENIGHLTRYWFNNEESQNNIYSEDCIVLESCVDVSCEIDIPSNLYQENVLYVESCYYLFYSIKDNTVQDSPFIRGNYLSSWGVNIQNNTVTNAFGTGIELSGIFDYSSPSFFDTLYAVINNNTIEFNESASAAFFPWRNQLRSA